MFCQFWRRRSDRRSSAGSERRHDRKLHIIHPHPVSERVVLVLEPPPRRARVFSTTDTSPACCRESRKAVWPRTSITRGDWASRQSPWVGRRCLPNRPSIPEAALNSWALASRSFLSSPFLCSVRLSFSFFLPRQRRRRHNRAGTEPHRHPRRHCLRPAAALSSFSALVARYSPLPSAKTRSATHGQFPARRKFDIKAEHLVGYASTTSLETLLSRHGPMDVCRVA